MGKFNIKDRDISNSMELKAQLQRRTSEIVEIINEFGEKERIIIRA